MRGGGIFLAVGSSSRLGRSKQLESYQGESLLRRAARTLTEVRLAPVAVVLGANADLCEKELEGLRVVPIRNENWTEGMGSSLRLGMRALRERDPELEFIVVGLCDQPLVTSDVIRSLVEAHRGSERGVAASEYCGIFGPPVLFHRKYFDAIEQLAGDRGARAIITANLSDVIAVPFPGGAMDIDTEEDVRALGCSSENRS